MSKAKKKQKKNNAFEEFLNTIIILVMTFLLYGSIKYFHATTDIINFPWYGIAFYTNLMVIITMFYIYSIKEIFGEKK